jgi:hypothetical protein
MNTDTSLSSVPAPPQLDSAWRRPLSVAEVAESSNTYSDFGYHLKDFLHTVHFTKRSGRDLAPLFADEPCRLEGHFCEGTICDAFLAAMTDYFCRENRVPTPLWAQHESRILAIPWFSATQLGFRALQLRDTPSAFKEKNIFICENALTVV